MAIKFVLNETSYFGMLTIKLADYQKWNSKKI